MSQFRVVEVITKREANLFIKVHVELNRNDPNWIRPLNKDVNEVFDPAKNKYYRHGKTKRWLLYGPEDQLVGRIAAYASEKYKNKGDKGPIGGIGFFDCIDNQEAANILFDTAKEWLAEEGYTIMDGPINFGERDKFWGLLIEGFTEPLYGMNYNQPYYRQLFESYGFRVYYNQLCYNLTLEDEPQQLNEKFYRSHEKFADKPGFEVQNVKKSNLKKYAADFVNVYNRAWAGHAGNKTMSEAQAYKIFRAMKPIMDEYLGWMAYKDGEPIAMWINIPDLNQMFRHVNGRLDLLGKLKFLFYKKFGKNDKFVGIIYGVVPEFQKTGIDYYLIVEAEKSIKKKTNYRRLELQWIGDFNPKMVAIARNLDGVVSRKLATFRYQFDREVPFHRHPLL